MRSEEEENMACRPSLFLMILIIVVFWCGIALGDSDCGTVIGNLVESGTGKPVANISLKPFAQKKVEVDGMGIWTEVLPDYEEVEPDESGIFIMKDVPPGVYSLRAIVGKSFAHKNKMPAMEFMRYPDGRVITFKVEAGQTINLGEIKVTKKQDE